MEAKILQITAIKEPDAKTQSRWIHGERRLGLAGTGKEKQPPGKQERRYPGL
jgi:hypothetical protein